MFATDDAGHVAWLVYPPHQQPGIRSHRSFLVEESGGLLNMVCTTRVSLSLFLQALMSHHNDSRLRNLCGVWVAPPAVAMLAYSSLVGAVVIGPVQRALFCE